MKLHVYKFSYSDAEEVTLTSNDIDFVMNKVFEFIENGNSMVKMEVAGEKLTFSINSFYGTHARWIPRFSKLLNPEILA